MKTKSDHTSLIGNFNRREFLQASAVATVGVIGSPVDFTYKLPFKFTGKIEKVTYEL